LFFVVVGGRPLAFLVISLHEELKNTEILTKIKPEGLKIFFRKLVARKGR
jgi:hypothetical protein